MMRSPSTSSGNGLLNAKGTLKSELMRYYSFEQKVTDYKFQQNRKMQDG